jgi:hypothetical protein
MLIDSPERTQRNWRETIKRAARETAQWNRMPGNPKLEPYRVGAVLGDRHSQPDARILRALKWRAIRAGRSFIHLAQLQAESQAKFGTR